MEFSRPVIEALNFQKWPRSDWQWPALQAHRGFWIEGQTENSMASLAMAKAKGFGMAEIDIRLSEDNVPVLSHDRDLRRLYKNKLKVRECTAKELEYFQIARLEEVINSSHRPEKLNIEIKKEDRWDSKLEDNVIRLLRKSKHRDEVIVSSFNPLVLKKFSQELPDVPRALLIDIDEWSLLSYFRLSGNLFGKAHMVNWPYRLLTKEIISFLKEAEVPVAAWTINDYRTARELLGDGVDSIITDRIVPTLI